MQQIFLLKVFCICQLASLSLVGAFECSTDSSNSHKIYFNVNSVRNKGGDWETSFIAHQNTSDHPKNIDVNVTRSFTRCQGFHIIQIGGILKDNLQEQKNTTDYSLEQKNATDYPQEQKNATGYPQEQKNSTDHPQEHDYEALTFKRSSKNAAITNNSHTLQRIKSDEPGYGITSRTLKDDEIFTLRIDEIGGRGEWGPGIGVIDPILEGQDLLNRATSYPTGWWIFFGANLYQNNTIVNNAYAKNSLADVQVGQTVGVMRSRFGNLHLFINGIDQGPASSSIPEKVYGIFELYDNIIKGTIVY